jgi:endonuclease YncB( thermonuclease family)
VADGTILCHATSRGNSRWAALLLLALMGSCLGVSKGRSQAHSTELTHASEDALLADCTDKNTPAFLPEVERAKVLSVYDGDTVTVAARLARQGTPWKWKVRLNGIDAPEIRGGSAATKAAAKASRDALRAEIDGQPITLTGVSYEKYGRLLATVHHNGRDMNE